MHGIRSAPLLRVKEVAEEDDAARGGAVEQRVEACECPGCRAARYRNAAGPERCGLPEVGVGDEQCLGTEPQDRTFRE
jgi:hypothetical protein